MSATLVRNEVLMSSADLDTVRDEVETASPDIKGFAAVLSNGETRELPPELSKIINLAFRAIATNGSVSVSTMPEELTSNTAAEIIGVSRPTLLKLAKSGEINSFKVGSHTRFKREEILAFKARREDERKLAFRELLEIREQLEDTE